VGDVLEMKPGAAATPLAGLSREFFEARAVELRTQLGMLKAKADQTAALLRQVQTHAAATQGALEECERVLKLLAVPKPQEQTPPHEG
jgi:hypothetical protein